MSPTQGIDAPVNYDELVGEKVHQIMWRQHRKQTEVAALLGVAQATLSRKIRGTRPWEVGEIYAVAEILAVPITDLLPERRNPHPDNPDGGINGRSQHDLVSERSSDRSRQEAPLRTLHLVPEAA